MVDDEHTHYKTPDGTWRPRIDPGKIASLVDREVTAQVARSLDVETIVRHIVSSMLQLPTVALPGPVHVQAERIRETSDPQPRMVVPVHLPVATWPDLNDAIKELALHMGGAAGTTSCGCLGPLTPAWETELSAYDDSGNLPDDAEVVSTICTEMQEAVNRLVECYRPKAEKICADAEQEVRARATRRVARLLTVDRVHQELGIALTPALEQDQVVLVAQELGADAFHARAAAGEPVPTLVREAREGVIRTIVNFTRALESLPTTAQRLADFQEPELRDVLLFVLNANWRGQAAGEVFTNQGKSDISLFSDTLRLFLAELKWWGGQKALGAAVDQLAGYTVARDTAACLVVLYKDRHFTQMQRTAEAALDAHPRIVGRIPTADGEPSRFQLQSSVDDGRVLELVFIPVCLALPNT